MHPKNSGGVEVDKELPLGQVLVEGAPVVCVGVASWDRGGGSWDRGASQLKQCLPGTMEEGWMAMAMDTSLQRKRGLSAAPDVMLIYMPGVPIK